MKKILFLLCALMVVQCSQLFAQCGTVLFTTANTYGITTILQSCNNTQLQFNWNCKRYSCPNNSIMPATSSATIKLRYNPTSASLTGSTLTTLTTTSFTAYNYNVSQSGYYWLEEVTAVTTTTQDCCGSTVNWVNTYNNGNGIGSAVLIAVQTAASATFKVDGNTVNASTYTQVYDCSSAAVQMTDITWAGTSSSFGYNYKVEITKVGSATPYNSGWLTGTPPISYPARTYISSTWGTVTGQYTIKLWVKNNCNPSGVAYTGLIQVNAAPTAATACIQLNNSLTCAGPLVNLGGSFATATPSCVNSPKVTGTCSGGAWVNGGWHMSVLEFDASGSYVKIVVNTPNMTLNNTSDIACLNLNDLSSPLGYFYSNPANYRYLIIFDVWNVCNASSHSQSMGYFIDNVGGCKTDGEETVITDPLQEAANSLIVYPNPTNGELNVSWAYTQGVEPTISLFSVEGKQVKAPMHQTGLGEIKLDVSGLAKGIYTLEINDGMRRVRRVIVQ